MTKQTNDRPIHYYDTQQHRIACGAGLADDHSTKHARGVTCAACISVLREQAREEAAHGAASAGAGV